MPDKKQLDKFVYELSELPANMRTFSLSLRSLYAENAVSSSSPSAIKVKKLRDDTRKDAIVYTKGVLPFSTQVVRSVQLYFEYYYGLTLEEWKENLEDVLDEVHGYKQCCVEVVRMHEEIMIPLKMRQDEAKVLVSELSDLTEEYERRQREYEKSASKKRSWGVALSFIPVVGVIAGPILNKGAADDTTDAVALTEQSKINEATILIVSEALIPALSAFIDGLNAAAGFFSVIENEIANFQSRGESAMQNVKKLHYTMMRNKANEIEKSCREFYAMLPGVRTDLLCIPEKADDQNYVDKWLAKQKEEIEQRYKSSLTSGLQKMMRLFTTEDAEQLMIEEN